MDEVKLLPCAHCGSKATAWLPPPEDGKVKHVWCSDSVKCGADLTLHEDGQDAIAAWNTRTAIVTDELVERAPDRESFETWARNAVPQFSAAGKHIRGGEWSYNHNIVEIMWQCWRAAIAAMPAIPPQSLGDPTEAMICAGGSAILKSAHLTGCERAKIVYLAMREAETPTPGPAIDQDGGGQ